MCVLYSILIKFLCNLLGFEAAAPLALCFKGWPLDKYSLFVKIFVLHSVEVPAEHLTGMCLH